jgi:hypothetical protein
VARLLLCRIALLMVLTVTQDQLAAALAAAQELNVRRALLGRCHVAAAALGSSVTISSL